MNNRIRELADEAAKYAAICALPTGKSGDELFVERFAELIEGKKWVGISPAQFKKLEQIYGNKIRNDFVFADLICMVESILKEENT
jgi:hypothetical protein